ncbi:MAG: hypothetical protein AB7I18_01200 [Candidatus Berkiella sp.]
MSFTRDELLDYASDVADALGSSKPSHPGLGFFFSVASPMLNLFQLYQASQRNSFKLAPQNDVDNDPAYRLRLHSLPRPRPY